MNTYWEKRRKTLEKLNKEMNDAFGKYAAWQSLLNQPRAFSTDTQSRSDAARAKIQAEADTAYAAYQSAKNEIDIFVYAPQKQEPQQITFL